MKTLARTPTSILMAEHRNIERVLACLERMADAFEEAGAVDPAPARDALEFLRTYADRLHHGKEEAQLFPAMERMGVPEHVGPTAVMRAEHVEGRAHIKAMGEAVDGGGVGRFVAEARGYAALLREHIMKEDQVLFPMADGIIPAAEQEALLGIFDGVEEKDIGHDVVGRMVALCGALCARYGVTEVPKFQGGSGCAGCSGH